MARGGTNALGDLLGAVLDSFRHSDRICHDFRIILEGPGKVFCLNLLQFYLFVGSRFPMCVRVYNPGATGAQPGETGLSRTEAEL